VIFISRLWSKSYTGQCVLRMNTIQHLRNKKLLDERWRKLKGNV